MLDFIGLYETDMRSITFGRKEGHCLELIHFFVETVGKLVTGIHSDGYRDIFAFQQCGIFLDWDDNFLFRYGSWADCGTRSRMHVLPALAGMSASPEVSELPLSCSYDIEPAKSVKFSSS